VIAAALMLLRRAWFATDRLVAGAWPRMELIGRELAHKRLGLVGYGAIARLAAEKARALGMKISAYDPFLPEDHPGWRNTARRELAQLLGESDVVSLHVPLNQETRRIIDAAALALMKPGAVLINAARGGVVDEQALVAALREGRLGGAALDVFEDEPLDASSGARFADTPNLILTPHIAGVTEESNQRVSAVIAAAVVNALGA
jgi:(S)-sulfolactate dehydrogenase